jgi:hypothetical protein
MLEKSPMARSRSRPNRSATIPIADGMKPPPPSAWMNRNTISQATFIASPHINEATVNVATNTRNMRLRPQLSLSRPAMGMARVWPRR